MQQIGKYIILEEIGRGGMGCVYKARDPVIERDVAIKVILERVLDVPEVRQRFYREARSAGRLAHENVVVVHDVGEDEGRPYIVMEFLEGRDLREAMNESRLSIDEKLEIALSICRGLRYAHEHGVIHRDVKPENIRLLDGSRVKIVDFGIARLDSGTQTLTHASIGTPRYMSPEQIKGTAVDHRTDIFSFGVLFYELLMGNIPFQGEHVSTLVYKILHEEPDPIELQDPRLAGPVQRILSRCLEKKVDRRYPDFGAVITDLQGVIKKRQETRTLPVDTADLDLDATITMPAGDRLRSPLWTSDRDSAPAAERPSRRAFRVGVAALLLAVAAAGAFALVRWTDVPGDTDMLAQSAAPAETRPAEETNPPDLTPADEPRDEGREAPDETQEEGLVTEPADENGASERTAEVRGAPRDQNALSEDNPGPQESQERALMESADAAKDEMERARTRIEGPHEDARVRSAFDEAESLRRRGLDQYEGGSFEEASASFQDAVAAYERTGELLAGQERQRADAARADMLAVKETVPPSVQQARPYQRALQFEEEGIEAYDSGDFARAGDRFSLAEGGFAEAGAPELVVQAEARAIQEKLRQAITEEDWSGVPTLVRDGYFQHVRDIRRHWRITDVTISDQAPSVDQNGAEASLPVTVTVHYVQPGGFDPGNYSLLFNWIWKKSEGVLQLAELELVRASG